MAEHQSHRSVRGRQGWLPECPQGACLLCEQHSCCAIGGLLRRAFSEGCSLCIRPSWENTWHCVCVCIECLLDVSLCLVIFSLTSKALDTLPHTNLPHSLQMTDDFPLCRYLMVYFASLLLVGIWVTTINNTSVNILPHAPEGSRTLSKPGKNHWLSHSCWVSITLYSTNLAHSLPLVGTFRLILMIPAHATSTSCFPTGNPVQRPSELRPILSVLRTEKSPQF